MNPMWKNLRKGPDAWDKLARGFEKKHVRPRLQPTRNGEDRIKERPALDRRSSARRAASTVKATMLRQLKRARKSSWRTVKRLVALLPLPLEEARTTAAKSELLALDRKLYKPDASDILRRMKRTRRSMASFGISRLPVIAGPWLSEIGFELLYWIPFLYWAKANAKLAGDKIWVVSRGGTELWYRHLTPNYVDVLDFYPLDEFHERNLERIHEQGGLKHKQITDFDREIVDRVEASIPGQHARLLHPSMMYDLFQPYFLKNAPVRLVEAFSFYRDIFCDPAIDPVPGLPDDYVAVKFYGNDALPDTDANRDFVRRLLSRLTATTHVVALDTGLRFDDHDDFVDLPRDRLHTVDGLTSPRHNLDVQTRVIRGARTFYCTYGGFSYLSPLCGTPTITFYSEPQRFKVEHLELAQRVFELLETPPFVALEIAHMSTIGTDLAVLAKVLE